MIRWGAPVSTEFADLADAEKLRDSLPPVGRDAFGHRLAEAVAGRQD